LAGAVATTVVGCSPQQQSAQQPVVEQAPTEQPAAQAPPSAFDSIEQMSPEDKRTQLGSSFPLEIPVPVGDAVLGKAQGPDVWDYKIEVARDPITVRDWYVQAYERRGWEILDTGPLTQGVPGYYFTARKNAAETRVDLVGESGAPNTVAGVVVGIGTPVLDTF
jgi:hypothetical protein